MLNIFSAAALIPALIISTAALAQDSTAKTATPYALVQGSLRGAPATLMIDQRSGQTWVLGMLEADGSVWAQFVLGNKSPVIGVGWIPLNVLAPSNPQK